VGGACQVSVWVGREGRREEEEEEEVEEEEGGR
jgi:hypothetical protein